MPFLRSLVPASSLAQQRLLSVTGLWAIGRIFGVLLVLFSLTMLIPLAVSWGYRDGEAASFLLTFGMTLTLGLALWLPLRQVRAELRTRDGFIIVGFITSTGFTTTDFSVWPLFLSTLLVFVGFVGGCGGSTAGGIKVLRVVLLFRNSLLEARKLVHPRLAASVKLGNRVVPQRIMDGVWGFFSLYVAVFVVLMLAVMATGVDQVMAFSAVATCINNMGPGLGEVGANFVPLSAEVKWLLVLAMWLGTLEMFTILVLLAPTLWRV